jgi:uncharacterized membrane protein YdbT with pleckstrin-like domain
MHALTLKPSPKYLTKLRLDLTIIAFLVFLGSLTIIIPVGLDKNAGPAGAMIGLAIAVTLDLAWYVPGMFLTGPYYRSIRYEIQDDEVIVHMGIFTKSVKHVPYRTVTNLTVKRGLLERTLFGLGTVNIQTAGMSGTTGAEESLVGLENYDEVYETVVTELRRFRGSMAPTAADSEDEPGSLSDGTLDAILGELKAIRQLMEQPGSSTPGATG